MIWQEMFIRMTDVLAWPLVGLYVALSVRKEVLEHLRTKRTVGTPEWEAARFKNER